MLAWLVATLAALAGQSVEGQPIAAVRDGVADAPKTVLVVGDIHGDERAGRAVVRALRRMDPPSGVQVHTVYSANPDGEDAGTRQNANGVDLNRNFPYRWKQGRGTAFSPYFPGPSAASEPETRAMMKLVRRVDPDVTIYYHQQLELVNLVPRADAGVIRRYARAVGLPALKLPYYHGTATSWQNKTFAGTTAFVVELPAGRLSPADARMHARAALGTVAPELSPAPAARAAASAKKPAIVQDRVPFGRDRKLQMAAYSKRHYGARGFKLTDVQTIVEHYTASDSYSSAHNTFAANAPDVEFGETPGVCAHFVIDSDGTVYQQVSLKLRCRHTVGLNDRSIGIEHVGTSDAAVIDNPKVLRASLKLTRWLQDRYDVPRRDVIGHNESLSSPYHHELDPRFQGQTHGDMTPATMRRYRRVL